MAADVYFHSLEMPPGQEFVPVDPGPCLTQMVDKLGLTGASRRASPWGLKVQVGEKGLPPAIDPAWARAVAGALAGSGISDPPRGVVCFDTLSITTGGLDKVDTHLERDCLFWWPMGRMRGSPWWWMQLGTRTFPS